MSRYAAVALLSALLVGAAPAWAQVNSYPGTGLGGSAVQRYPSGAATNGSRGAAARGAQQRLDDAKHGVMSQSCAGMAGPSADRCFSELRTTIESDRLKQQSLQSGPFRDGR